MSDLKLFEIDDGLEYIINLQTGEAFTSIAGYSRMSLVPSSTVSDRVTKYNSDCIRNKRVEKAKIQTDTGFSTVRLIPAKLAYKWSLKDNLNLAEKMGECGATVYFHQQAGYKITSSALSSNDLSLLILEEVREIRKEMAKIEPALTFLDEMRPLLEEVAEQIKKNPDQTRKYVRDWMKGTAYQHLQPGTKNAIGRQLACFWKTVCSLSYKTENDNCKYPEAYLPVIKKVVMKMAFN